MRSLFGKIFLWFCTTVVLGIVSTFLVAYLFNLPGPDNDASPINHLLRMSGRDMAEAYDQGGVQGLRSFIDVLKKRTDLNSRLYDLSGRDLSGLPPMDGFDEAARAHLDTVPMPSEEDRTKEMQDFSPLGPPGPPGAPRMHAPPDMSRHDMPIPTIRHRGLVVSRWTFTREGGTYLVVTHLPSPIKFLKRVAGRDFFFRLGVFFMAGVLFSYLLAKYLSQPVRRLQHAARKMRAGDLSVRVGEDKRLHYTEIHDLARDFDSMAERLERMIMAQRRLVRDVSHELRSPLTRLNLSLELARKRTTASASTWRACRSSSTRSWPSRAWRASRRTRTPRP
jgi:two-component system sensor histidine kinase CpxA